MQQKRLQKLAGIVTEAKYSGKWCVVKINRYDSFASKVNFVQSTDVASAIKAVYDEEEADWMLNSGDAGNQGKDVWGWDGEEQSVIVFPVR